MSGMSLDPGKIPDGNKHENGEYPDQMNTGKVFKRNASYPPDRIIRARWVLNLVKSSDQMTSPVFPKARLVLIGWEDPELGKIAGW